MNDVASKCPALSPDDRRDALAHGVHGDPFAVLGPHDTAMGRIVRAFLPGALRSRGAARATDEPSLGTLAAERRRTGLFVGRVSERRALSAAHRLAGRGAGNRRSLFLRPAARRPRSASVQRRPAFRTGVASRRAASMTIDGVQRRALRRLGAECARASPWSAISTPGIARRHPMRLRYPRRRVGTVRAAPRRRARATNSRSSVRTGGGCR